MRSRSLAPVALLVLLPAAPALAGGGFPCDPPTTEPREEYSLFMKDFGQIRIRLLDQPGEAPGHVANFKAYADRGDYDGTFFHRMIPDFVLQGGGFYHTPADGYEPIFEDDPIPNEPGICNVRGTVAMAKLGGQPNSATNQFFINLADNTQLLGNQNGGFTVFGVVHPDDMPIVDELAELHREYGPIFADDRDDPGDPDDVDISPLLDNLPVIDLLDRPPQGWGCVGFIDPDPVFYPQFGIWLPDADQEDCGDDEELIAEARALIYQMTSPQLPELLLVVETVPEPGAVLQLAAGAAALAGLSRARRRRVRRG